MVADTTASEFGTSCETMFLFITDGDPTEGSISFDTLPDLVH